MADTNFSSEQSNSFAAETNTQSAPAPDTTPAATPSAAPSDSKSEMDKAFDDAWSKRGRDNPASSSRKTGGTEAPDSSTPPSAGDGASPTRNTSPNARGESGEPAGSKGKAGDDDQSIAERRAFNRQQAAMRIARKQERQRIYQEELDRLNQEKEAFEQEGENQNPTMAAVKEDQIKELNIQMVRELQAEWEREAYEMFTPQDAAQFLADTKTYGDWINKNEPELRQYMNRPYGRYLLKGWLDKVAKVPANADKWQAMNPYQKYQMLEKHYKELEKFGEDYAAGKVQIGNQTAPQTAPQNQAQSQGHGQPQQPQDVPVPGSGRNTNNMPPSDNWGLMLQDAENRRKK